MNKIALRIGLEHDRAAVRNVCLAAGIPVLISANSLWNHASRRFTVPTRLAGLDVALDSGGFVAMKLHGGYRFTPAQYLNLAATLAPTWWAQMDLCCEPELATDRAAIRSRITATAANLSTLNALAADTGTAPPLPVLQGWLPSDYTQGPIFEGRNPFPSLVGVGSVCRRPLHGPAGLLPILAALDQAAPPSTRFHLFGVKSTALLAAAQAFPHRIASADSMAYNRRASRQAHDDQRPCSSADRARAALAFHHRHSSSLAAQAAAPRQLALAL